MRSADRNRTPRKHGMRQSTSMSRSRRRWTLLLLTGSCVLHCTAFFLMLARVDPFYRFFYSFAWWSFILIVASYNQLKSGNSPLLSASPGELFLLFIFSNLTWLFFEVLNFQLNNWHYTGVPLEEWLRWPGVFVAFGTVFPGIFETATLLRNLNLFTQIRIRPLLITGQQRLVLIFLGAVMMILPMLWPTLFFPLVWIGLILLMDPLLYAVDPVHSVSEPMERGECSRLFQLLASGLVCGLLWEFWNYWAGAKWSYTIPYLGFGKVFEMPVLGYLGFLPFALECYLIYHFLLWAFQKARRAGRAATVFLLLAALLFTAASIAGIDRYTVERFEAVF